MDYFAIAVEEITNGKPKGERGKAKSRRVKAESRKQKGRYVRGVSAEQTFVGGIRPGTHRRNMRNCKSYLQTVFFQRDTPSFLKRNFDKIIIGRNNVSILRRRNPVTTKGIFHLCAANLFGSNLDF